MTIPFKKQLLQGIAEHLSSPQYRYVDNSLAYYSRQDKAAMQSDKEWFAHNAVPSPAAFIQNQNLAIEAQVLTKGPLYAMLADRHSRETLLLTALYELLGHRFVKFPYYAENTIKRKAELAHSLAVHDTDEAMRQATANDAFGVGFSLSRYAITIADQQITLYTNPEFIYQIHDFPPYRYEYNSVVADISQGDFVIDCGACYGDTALLFAAKAGLQGKVLSFEPHPEIGKLFLYNRASNPDLARRISFVPAATGEQGGKEASLTLYGAGSRIGSFVPQKQRVNVPLLALDQEIARHRWSKVDFIKMDVEGAELATLCGAQSILRRFRPKLAVCLYHRQEDFFTIPKFLSDLHLNYVFYLEHHFMNNWETVLYALPA